jgi:hypothetical protein
MKHATTSKVHRNYTDSTMIFKVWLKETRPEEGISSWQGPDRLCELNELLDCVETGNGYTHI